MAFITLDTVSKFFPGVTALDAMSLSLRKGEIHGLIGENGAGKSTLIKILTGLYKPEEGTLSIDDTPVHFSSTGDALAVGIGCIYQELNIVQQFSVLDNIFLGREIRRSSGFLDYPAMAKKSREILESLGQDINPYRPVNELGMGQQQMVEIAKSLSQEISFLIMDEPSSSLSNNEVEELKKTVFSLKEKGVGILFVSHKLEEIFELCDLVTVMRDGQHITTEPTTGITKDRLIRLMVGRELNHQFPQERIVRGEEILRLENFTRYGFFQNINLSLHRGEILGFSGLVGAGRTELFRAVFGADPLDKGSLFLDQKKITITSPSQALAAGMAFVTEDRKGEGLVLGGSVHFNLALTSFQRLQKNHLLDTKAIKAMVEKNIDTLRIKTPNSDFVARQLSGGNQQKVVIGKWLNTQASVYIFDEPTRGIDVGAKTEVYHLIKQLAAKGFGVIMISSELPEILGMSDRVIVMRKGRIMLRIKRDDPQFNQEDIMKASWNDEDV